MPVRIFLSAVSDEFADYRDRLRSELTRHNVEVKVQEDFKDYGGVTLDKLDLYITACDAVVHLIGDMTGSDAKPASTNFILSKYTDFTDKLSPLRESLEKGLSISYTQWEAWLALYHRKALLIAKASDEAPRGPKYVPTDVSRAAQQIHLERLRAVERHPGCTFTSHDNLAKQIAYTVILDLLANEPRPPEKSQVLQPSAAPIVEAPIGPSPAATPPPPISPEKPPKEFVAAHVTPEFLAGLYAGQAAKYIGKWMPVSGPLLEAFGGWPFLKEKTPAVTALAQQGRPSVIMVFHGEWIDRLAVIPKDQSISAHGQINEIGHSKIVLENCELIDSVSAEALIAKAPTEPATPEPSIPKP